MAEELDDIGKETAAVMRTMLQIATLVALRTRERGQKEAEARVKITEARMKEARELQVREARESKAKDPRNIELTRLMDRAPTPSKGLSLEKDRYASQRDHSGSSGPSSEAVRPLVRYDSAERRGAIAQHLERLGIAPELAAVRMLMEAGHGTPPDEAVRKRPENAPSVQRNARELDARGLERTRN